MEVFERAFDFYHICLLLSYSLDGLFLDTTVSGVRPTQETLQQSQDNKLMPSLFRLTQTRQR
jgi:hypothetical protein